MQFQRIAVVDDINIPLQEQERISELSRHQVDFPADDPPGYATIAERTSEADAILVSWRTPITDEILNVSPDLRFIGLAASAFARPESCNIDLWAARERGITVSTLGQYGDEATAEWILAMMLNVAAHISSLHWQQERRELFGKSLGIIGMGHMGRHVAQRAQALGLRVVYWSRTRKSDVEGQGCQYLPLTQLLGEADIVSVHVGKGVQVMRADEFRALKPGVMLINTSLGPVFEAGAFGEWLDRRDGIAFSDKDVDRSLGDLMKDSPNALISSQSAGDSFEMKCRKGEQLRANLLAFLKGEPIRIAPF